MAEQRTTAAEAPANENRSTTPASDAFRQHISSGWAERPVVMPAPREQAPYAAARRLRISALHPEKTIVIPAGDSKQRSNDTDYPYRAHSAFSHLTGWGSDTVPGSVLVLEPSPEGHTPRLYLRPSAGRGSDEFYANPAIGEFWTGARPSLEHVAADLALPTGSLEELDAVLGGLRTGDGGTDVLVVREADPALTRRIDALRREEVSAALAREVTEASGTSVPVEVRRQDAASALDESVTAWHSADAELARDLSELRLVKDAYEIAQMREAIEATHTGFDDVVAALPEIVSHPRGERVVEGTFNRRARIEGNTVGYDTIAAAGAHACILHWVRNDGPVLPGDLVLIDAGVELDSLYTADITRTLPASGRFNDVQRRVYDAVLEAADAAFAAVRPGIRFREVHAAAMQVIARKTAEWGLLPVTAAESLEPEAQYHRRYMVHGTSHHLGIDVHDCAQARRDFYHDGIVEAGMVFTIEPGLYFQPDDLTVPEEYRGIGVRIEDDILVTANGAENLSRAIPRTADEVEAWIARSAS
ncbi:aminopeptidase P family protein [Ruicaihuangia caeni]|uniref:aminopeptidase P family protein n=1 Tax=Ruicaihuangia caeni TaxID=3042517 RepID=UPI00338E7398